jgi:hypothetical protein
MILGGGFMRQFQSNKFVQSFLGLIFCAVSFTSVSSFAYGPQVPDQEMTPGAICTPKDSDYDRLRYKSKIAYCDRNVSEATKQQVYENYGISERCQREYTIDHLIPLSIGGSNRIENLWPEHKSIKLSRLHFEEEIMNAVQYGQLTQAQAIEQVRQEKFDPKNRPESGPSRCH